MLLPWVMLTGSPPLPTPTGADQHSAAPDSPGEHVSRFLERHEAVLLGILLVSVLVLSILIGRIRPMWFDELFTMLLATQPNLHEFWRAMPADGNPPLLALLGRMLVPVFGHTELSVRLPSMIAFAAACGGLYAFVHYRTSAVAAFFAVSIVLFQPAWFYAYEARPYALLLAFFVLTLVCWQRAASMRNRRVYLAGMAVGIAGAMFSHHIGLAEVGFPIVLGELWRLYRRRRPDWPLYSTFLIAIPVLAVTFPMMYRTRVQLLTLATHRQPKITVHVVLDWLRAVKFSLPTLLSEPSIIVLFLLVLATWVRTPKSRRDLHDARAIAGHEIVAALGAALLIPVTLVLLMVSSNYYNARYGIGCVVGLAILAAFSLARNLPNRRDVVAGLTAVLLLGLILDAKSRMQTMRSDPNLPAVPAQYADQPIATANVFSFFPAWFYGGPEMHARLHFVFDMDTAVADNNALPEASMMLERGRLDAHLDQFLDFVSSNPRFVGYIPPGTGSGIADRIRDAGFSLAPISTPESHLYEVTRNGQ